MGLLDLFGLGKKSKQLRTLVSEGAVIIDVRTPREYNSGHISGSMNIPLDDLNSQMKKLLQIKKPLVLCCASGMRSRTATSFLKGKGFDSYNGGSWMRLNALIS